MVHNAVSVASFAMALSAKHNDILIALSYKLTTSTGWMGTPPAHPYGTELGHSLEAGTTSMCGVP